MALLCAFFSPSLFKKISMSIVYFPKGKKSMVFVDFKQNICEFKYLNINSYDIIIVISYDMCKYTHIYSISHKELSFMVKLLFIHSF